ncbi:saccharopine dehydrogenase [Pararhodobacter sp. SW119]|uniref:saccharopine dehydrogenase n=1 Tax=Pararhodobacter sp. SW119 TaxID=2780075 RepID=UPI001ADF1401|nr:saccharopine dehydrogenase [Pararhodobacter sp. SW119]
MTHLWVRAEERADEARVALTPEGAAELIARGFRVTVEDSPTRALPFGDYMAAGCEAAAPGSWREAPADAIILGLKELPEEDTPLRHRHILFGHAFKGQPAGARLLRRFRTGGGTLYDLESLTDETGRRVAAFGYWAGYVGAAVTLKAWAAQARGEICGRVAAHADRAALLAELTEEMGDVLRPDALVIGAKGRTGRGATDLLAAMNVKAQLWDKEETAQGGPFPQILGYEILLNCILAEPGGPVFVPADAVGMARRLRVIGDIACDPGADYSPIRVYDRVTSWAAPALRVHAAPRLDVVAIDNLPAILPVESSRDFAAQLLPYLTMLDRMDQGVWARARSAFERHAP